jgi:hypothetical protein
MFERLERSFELVKASAAVLRQDKELVLFPLISACSLVAVMVAFILPAVGIASLDSVAMYDQAGKVSPYWYILAFFFYLCNYTVIFYFNTALVAAAMIRMDGGDPTLKDGLRIASSKIGTIFTYALISATVGMVLRMIQERVGFIGKIVIAFIGVGWALATYLVVPVLAAHDDVGPIDAIKESATLFKETWGENVIGQAGIGLAFGLIMFGIGIVGVGLIMLAAGTKSMFLVVTMVVIVVLAFALATLVKQALEGIYAAALYRYASTGSDSPGFSGDAMRLAFAPK